MRIVIVSRIFAPEPAAASYLLEACALAFHEAGHRVLVVTTAPPKGLTASDAPGIDVRRTRVKRDRQGYVRGYVSYLSFDIPLFFRLLFGRKADLYLVEPPPTTGAVVRVVAALRRTPYVYDAADLWSDAAGMVTSSRFVLGALRRVERFALRGARHAFAISEGLIGRLRELGIDTPATSVGFGVDTTAFRFEDAPAPEAPLLVYGGSYSEWHGAGIFVEAFALFVRSHPHARLVFVGNGSDRPALEKRCRELGLSGVEFRDTIPGAELSRLLAGATASLASLKPGQGYDYAFTTKVYASLATGCPVLFTGTGPTGEFMRAEGARHPVGVAVEYSIEAVEGALVELAGRRFDPAGREKVAEWARTEFALASVARRIVAECESLVEASDA